MACAGLVRQARLWQRVGPRGAVTPNQRASRSPGDKLSYVPRLLRLTLLAPDIVEAILDGRQTEGMTLPGLMEPIAVAWQEQLSALSG